eukprot:m.15921 g.15921  ORF g.15921 m.15921 type:complete len:65 (+) comp10523_c0_seq5:2571-2765(+)
MPVLSSASVKDLDSLGTDVLQTATAALGLAHAQLPPAPVPSTAGCVVGVKVPTTVRRMAVGTFV